MRIDKFLSNMGMGSRTEVKRLLAKGMVTVNGQVVKSPKDQLDPDVDKVCCGTTQVAYKPFIYLMLNKPQGYISATEDRKLKTVLELVPKAYGHYDLFPAGRLDRDTVGLLLLTNDGDLAHKLLSPKYHVGKTYRVTAAQALSDEDLEKLTSGVVIGQGYLTLPAHVKRIGQTGTMIDLTIREGKYHQVKEMLQAVSNQVVFLERITFGPLDLDANLERGQIRELTQEEIDALQNSAQGLSASGDQEEMV